MIKPRGWNLYDGRMIEAFGGDFYFKSDYKALEKERDEGLAREAVAQARVTELQDALQLANDYNSKRVEILQQRLVEAEKDKYQYAQEVIKLLCLLEDDFDDRGIEDGSMPKSTEQWNNVSRQAYLTSYGCADGENK